MADPRRQGEARVKLECVKEILRVPICRLKHFYACCRFLKERRIANPVFHGRSMADVHGDNRKFPL